MVGPSIPDNMVYLTYFEGIDSTVSPMPIVSRVGDTGLWNNGNNPNTAFQATIPSGGEEYSGVPAVGLNMGKEIYPRAWNVPQSTFLNLFNNGDTISLECILYVPTLTSQSRQWMGILIGLGSYPYSKYFYLGVNTYAQDRGIYVGLPRISEAYGAASGFHAFFPDSQKVVGFSSDDENERFRLGIHHLAIVFTRYGYLTKGYIDGKLAGTIISNSGIQSVAEIRLSNDLNKDILFTQLAISSGDRSTDEGATYPMPIKPYVKF